MGEGLTKLALLLQYLLSMAGEKRQGNAQGSEGREANLNPDRIQEYDFFVTPDGGETSEGTPGGRREKTKKKKSGRNKSTTFFLSD